LKLIKIFLFLTLIFFILLQFKFPSYSAEENACMACHGDVKKPAKSIHAALEMGCSACHKSVEGKSHPEQKGSIILTKNIPGLCYGCHDKAKFTKKYVHKIIDVGGCSSCHAPHISNHPSLLINSEHELCISCHAAKLKLSHVIALPGRKRHPISGVKDPSTLKMILVPDPKNPKKQVEVPDPNVPGKEMSCASCHDPHSSDFTGLLTQARICTKCHKY